VKKRGNGEGTIFKRKDGRWCARYTVGTVEGLKRRDAYGETRREVAKKLGEALDESHRGSIHSSVSLGDFLKGWLADSVYGSVSPRTFERYEQVVRLHIEPALGRTKLADLSPVQVQRLYRAKPEGGLSPRSVQYVHVTLHKALEQAVSWGYVSRNVTALLKAPRANKDEVNPLSVKQIQKLLSSLGTDRDRALFTLAVITGIRRREMLALRWEDVDLEAQVLRVKRSLSEINEGTSDRGLVFTVPKTIKGKRSIALTPHAIGLLDKYRQGSIGVEPADLVFPNPVGEPMRPRSLTQHFKRVSKRCGLPATVRLHDLRHTAATLLPSKGIHPKIVQEILGHSTISITLDTYSHVLPNMQEGAMRAMQEVMSLDNGSDGEGEKDEAVPYQSAPTRFVGDVEKPEGGAEERK
jgi:integrase